MSCEDQVRVPLVPPEQCRREMDGVERPERSRERLRSAAQHERRGEHELDAVDHLRDRAPVSRDLGVGEQAAEAKPVDRAQAFYLGERYWPAYFRAVRDALVPGGRAAIQAITIADHRFERYRTQSDFIQRHVFPGGMLASPARLAAEARAAGLAIAGEHAFGRDYAETLRRWLAAFDAHAEAIARRFDPTFVRCWRFYLAYCAAGFDTGTTDVHQFTLIRC